MKSTNSYALFGRLLAFGCLWAAPVLIAEDFSFQITATGTTNVISFPNQKFTWTVKSTAQETWSTTEIMPQQVDASASANGRDDGRKREPFTPAETGQAKLRWMGSEDRAAWSVQIVLDGKAIFTAIQFGPKQGERNIPVSAGRTYELAVLVSGDGYISASFSYPGFVNVEQKAVRMGAYPAPESTVNATEGDKFWGFLPSAAEPRAEQGGRMSQPTFEFSTNNERVKIRLDGVNVFARTTYSETNSLPWQQRESGRATVTPSDGEKLITTNSLIAPNGDTRWFVEDDNPNVETWMVGNKLFAKVVQTPPAKLHSADYRDPHWPIDESEMNRVLAYWRAGGYHVDAAGLDGFAAGGGPAGIQRHSADYREPFWVIDDTEMNRVLGYWRAGGYEVNPNGPDGFAPIQASAQTRTDAQTKDRELTKR